MTNENTGVDGVGIGEKRELTYGEQAVGLDFNPSQNEDVYKCKKAFAEEIDRLHTMRESLPGPSEKGRLISEAITQIQTAQMWAVKAIIWHV